MLLGVAERPQLLLELLRDLGGHVVFRSLPGDLA